MYSAMDSGTDPPDLRHYVVILQMTIKELCDSIGILEKKVDFTSDKMSTVEKRLVEVRQQQIISKMEKGPTLVDIENLLKTHVVAASPAPVVSMPTHANGTPHTVSLSEDKANDREEHKVSRKDEHPSSILDTPVVRTPNTSEDLIRELDSFQRRFMSEFNAQQTALTPVTPVETGRNRVYDVPEKIHAVPYSCGSCGNVFLDDALFCNKCGEPRPGACMCGNILKKEEEYCTKCGRHRSGTDYPEDVQQEKLEADLEAARAGEDEKGAQKPQDEQLAEVLEEEIDHGHINLREDTSLAAVFSSDDDVEAPSYDVSNYYYTTGINQAIARSKHFENGTVLVVVINAVYIGVDSDYNNAQNIYKADMVFQIFSQFFCVYFTWELLTRFLAFEHKKECLKDGWFKFDAFLVSTMILDTWLLMPTLYIIGGGVTIPTQPLRMLRLFKLTRMARLMKAFPELVTMIKGLVRSLRAISSSMILIGLMVYVWAIMMHMLLKEEKEFNDQLWEENQLSFGTITKCIWTLIMDGTLMLDNAAPLMTTLLFNDNFSFVLAGGLFMLYALLSAMLILQMLIGVLCDVVSRVGQEERDGVAIGLIKQELLEDLKQFDDGDGKISQHELHEVMCNPNSKALLKRLNINRLFLMELQKMMFPKSSSQVTIKSVLELMILCRGDNATTVEAMSGGLLSIINTLTEMKTEFQEDLDLLKVKVGLRSKGGRLTCKMDNSPAPPTVE
jgi:voltage-gated sodium channel